MKIIFSESRPDYSTYSFPYNIYAVAEPGDTWEEFYRKGFLPYSDIKYLPDHRPWFYMARSIRIDLSKFSLTSENRRIRKRSGHLKITYEIVPKQKIHFDQIKDFVLRYSRERIGQNMTDERLKYIFDSPLLNKIAVFKSKSQTIAYVWLVEENNFFHYWFSFFDTGLLSFGIGKRIMEEMISHAKNSGKKHIYLGTCYGPKALYKVRDFKGVEFFSGNEWSTDTGHLKEKCRSDTDNQLDDFKRFPGRFKQ